MTTVDEEMDEYLREKLLDEYIMRAKRIIALDEIQHATMASSHRGSVDIDGQDRMPGSDYRHSAMHRERQRCREIVDQWKAKQP